MMILQTSQDGATWGNTETKFRSKADAKVWFDKLTYEWRVGFLMLVCDRGDTIAGPRRTFYRLIHKANGRPVKP